MTIDYPVLLAGCGSIGRRHGRVLQTELGLNDLSACDPSSEAREAFAREVPGARLFADYETALDAVKPRAVFILSPTRLHLCMAKRALECGCHVFIEKPLAMGEDGVDELRRLAEEKGLCVMVGFCFRFHEALKSAKRLLEDGAIGRLISVRALMGEPFYKIQPNYKNMYYSKYSGAFELIHDIDLAIWFANQPLKRVQAVYGSFSDMGMDSPDTVEMLMEFEDRLVANVHLDFFQSPRRRQIDLIGMNGVITVEFASWDEATVSLYTLKSGRWERQRVSTRRDDMFRDEDAEFFDCVRTGRGPATGIGEALKSLRAVAQVYTIPEGIV